MKKIVLQMLLRAAQTAVISFIVALVFNYMVINLKGMGYNFNFDWMWIVQAIILSVVAFVTLLFFEKATVKGKSLYDGEGVEALFASLIGIAVTVTEGIDGLHKYDVSEWISLIAVIWVVCLGLFNKQSSRSILFACFFTAVYGIFFNVDYAHYFDWYFSFLLLSVVIIATRIIRFIVVFLFIKDHFPKKQAEMNVLKQ
jgi:hypothetical protein